MYSKKNILLCFSQDIRQAALFYDQVIPADSFFHPVSRSDEEAMDEAFRGYPDNLPYKVMAMLMYGNVPDKQIEAIRKDYFQHKETLITELYSRIKGLYPDVFEYQTLEDALDDDTYIYIDELYRTLEIAKNMFLDDASFPDQRNVRKMFLEFSKKIQVPFNSVMFPYGGSSSDDDSEGDMYFSLINIPLIDTSKSTWRQIMELRKDENAKAKLRRLRLFLYDNYKDKSVAYVEDDLLQRIQDYKGVSKKHGFELRLSVLSALLNAQNLHAAAAGGIGAALLGGPVSGVSTAIAIEVGNICVEVAKRKRTLKESISSHPLSFIFYANERINR